MPTIETMTLNDVTAKLRAMGIRTSEPKVAAGIVQGAYPFGIFIDYGKRRNFEIYKKLFDEWVETRCTEDGAT